MRMKINPARMRYKNDSRAASFCYIGIAFDAAYFIALYSNNAVIPNLHIGADVIANILFMLAAFWAGEMVKVYNKKWALGALVLALLQFARIFWVPRHYHRAEMLTGGAYTMVCVFLILSGLAMVVSAFISYTNSSALERYMKSIT